MKNVLLLLLLVFSSNGFTWATDTTLVETQQEYSEEEIRVIYQHFLDSVEQTMRYETGLVTIGDNVAELNVPAGFKYLNGKDSDMVLTDLWGNPPSDEADKSLGMLLLAGKGVTEDSTFVINITYSTEGFIDDADAKDMNFDELLSTMRDDIAATNDMRIEAGYEPVQLIGWASPPFYDEANKKLHWAKEIKFGESIENTLNYNIRILGRRGYLELNVIGGMEALEQVKSHINPILASVNFKEGNRYIDFDPKLDKVAAVGIGGLIAGKVLAKAGILAKLGIFLAKFWKVIALAIVGLGVGVKRFFTKETKEERTGEV
jgi:uncharacterized membrane-anchored protein